jgi:hypothetical protein
MWLDNITRELLDSGTLQRYIDDYSITGLTSKSDNLRPAIKNGTEYDLAIRKKIRKGSRKKNCSSNWHSRTSLVPPTCFGHLRPDERNGRPRGEKLRLKTMIT